MVSEYDYAMQEARRAQPISRSRLFMAFDGRWKYIHAPGFRPMLFDLVTIRLNSQIAVPFLRA